MIDPASEDVYATLPKNGARTDCITHCSDEGTFTLVSIQDLDSWKCLLRAAEIRQHPPVWGIARGLDEDQIPQIKCHRKCRSIFTMKKLFDSIRKHKQRLICPRISSRDEPATSKVYGKICVFCNATSKYLNGNNTRESLTQSVELRADDRIRSVATLGLDPRIFALLSQNLKNCRTKPRTRFIDIIKLNNALGRCV